MIPPVRALQGSGAPRYGSQHQEGGKIPKAVRRVIPKSQPKVPSRVFLEIRSLGGQVLTTSRNMAACTFLGEFYMQSVLGH